jgi:hypothetical protein
MAVVLSLFMIAGFLGEQRHHNDVSLFVTSPAWGCHGTVAPTESHDALSFRGLANRTDSCRPVIAAIVADVLGTRQESRFVAGL